MANDQRRIDRLSQERTEDSPPQSRPDGDLDMGGGGPTGASGPGTPHRSNLDTGGGSPLAGALDDLPDMTGSNPAGSSGSTSTSGAAAPGGSPTTSASDTFESTIGDADINPPSADNANMGRGSDRFDASDAYTGVDSDDAVLESRPSGSAKGRKSRASRPAGDMTGSGDSGSAGDDLGDMSGQGISPEDFRTQGSGQ